jgi:carboxylesterase
MGAYLASQGMSVHCPLLTGHGTQVEDLTRRSVRWQRWAEDAETALGELQAQCETVFVAGLSLGSLLTLWMGSKHPEISGLVVMAPAIKEQSRLGPVARPARWVLKYNPFGGITDDDPGDPQASDRLWSYDKIPLWSAAEALALQRQVRRALPEIRQPILIFQGRRDPVLSAEAAQIVYDGVGSTDKTLAWLENSGHNLLVDAERAAVYAQSYAWMMDRANGG